MNLQQVIIYLNPQKFNNPLNPAKFVNFFEFFEESLKGFLIFSILIVNFIMSITNYNL